jgi:hypothetical protein
MDSESSFRSAILSIRLKTVLFPIDTIELLRELQSDRGFVLVGEAAQAIFPLQGLAGMISGDPLARKGDLAFGVDTDKQVLRLRGPDPIALLPEWRALEQLLESRFGIRSEHAWFHELQTSLSVRTGQDPTRVFARVAPKPILKGATAVLGKETSLFGLRLSAPGDPNSATWYEVRVEPNVQAATREYFTSVVYRSADRDDVYEFVETIGNKVATLIGLFEAEK